MKTQIQIIVAAFVLAIGMSTPAWSQQAQTDKSQKGKQFASNKTRPETDTSSESTVDRTSRTDSHTDSIEVVGHPGLSGAVVTNLRTLEDSSVQILEVTDSTTHTLNLVDVSDPSHPKIVQRIHKPASLENSRLEVEVGHAALFAEVPGTSARPAPRTITLVSLANPEDPKTMRQFTSVSFIAEDRARKLIYLANPDGLWVLQAYSSADRRALEKQFDEMLRSAQSGG